MASIDHISRQLEEIEVVQSIFGDAISVDHEAISFARLLVTGEISIVDARSLSLSVATPGGCCHISLPTLYPSQPPIVTLAASSRSHHDLLISELGLFFSQSDGPCLYELVEWLMGKVQLEESDSVVNVATEEDISFSRIWIYSHHIYNKNKRKFLINWATERRLTGFSLSGKPGVVCVEGLSTDVEDYWRLVRGENWQHITIKHRESAPLKNRAEVDPLRKFGPFEEKRFGATGKHSDLGALARWLDDLGERDVFAMFFGVGGS